jgi:hypothetical protein
MLPPVQILQPYPVVRFDAKHPISEVRTVCASSASTGPCGVCRVTGTPTATSETEDLATGFEGPLGAVEG